MADEHDEALAWAQSNPQDPRSQDIQAKAWAYKNPQDPRSSQIMQRLSQSSDNAHPKNRGLQANFEKAWNYKPSEEQMVNAAKNPNTGMEDPAYQLAGLVSPNSVITGASKLLSKPGDALMQMAVGLKKRIPGLGEQLADAGLVGTKGMMQNQVAKGLETTGKQIGDLASTVRGISTKPVAESIGEEAARLVGPDGNILPENVPAFNKFSKAASTASQQGNLTGPTAAARRTQYGEIAQKAGAFRDNPAQTLKSQLADAQRYGYSQALKQAPAGPAYGDAIAEADARYSALMKAHGGLNQPESLTPFGLATKAVPTAIGAGVAGAPGAAAGALMSTPLGQSTLGRSLIGLGKLAKKAPVDPVPALQKMLTPDNNQQ